MPTLDYMIRRGPPDGDLAVGLDLLRDEVLRNGVPANGDGMVSLPPFELYLLALAVKMI